MVATRVFLARRSLLLAAALLTLLSLCSLVSAAETVPAKSSGPKTIAPADLRPGMKGYGLTVIRGTKIERFDIEIIGVLQNAMPQQDMVLIRCAGLNLEHSGIVAGMSGSPVFVTDPQKGDLLVGALSYGFPFNKDPVAGVTPIANMLPEMERKLVPVPINQRVVQLSKTTAAAVHMPTGAEMQPVAVPLVLSGFDPQVAESMREPLRELGFPYVQMATGGTAKSTPAPRFEPGSAISLSLARGDIAITGIGTVTWVDGDHFVAFGHPFKGLGQVHLPVGGADIQWILSSQNSSFKMGTALADAGVLDQDRQSAIAGRMNARATMVPVRVNITNKDRKESHTWNVEVTDQPLFFPLAVSMVVGNAVRSSEPIAENVALTMKLRFDLGKAHAPIELEEVVTGLSGMASVGEVSGLVMNVAKTLVYNGFERLRVERVDATFEVSDDRNVAFLEAVRAPSEEVDAGQPIPIRVRLNRPNAEPVWETLTLPPLSRELAGTTLQVQVGPEKNMAPEQPEPADIEDVLHFLRSQIPRNRLAAVVTLPEPTVMLRGARLVGLPLAVRDEIAGHQVQVRAGKETLRTHIDLPWTLNGSVTLKLRVRPLP